MQGWTRRNMLHAAVVGSLAALVPFKPMRGKRFQKSLTLGFGTYGTRGMKTEAAIKLLDEIGYDGFASVKVYRKAGFREAAQRSLDFLRALA